MQLGDFCYRKQPETAPNRPYFPEIIQAAIKIEQIFLHILASPKLKTFKNTHQCSAGGNSERRIGKSAALRFG